MRGKKMYLVAWEGYSELFDSTWLSLDDLGDATQAVTDWEDSK